MTQFRNVSPLGSLDVPDLGRVVDAGEVFEVPEHLAPMFAAQPSNYEPADDAAAALSESAASAQAAAEAAALAAFDDELIADDALVDEPDEQPAPARKRATKPAPTTQEVAA